MSIVVEQPAIDTEDVGTAGLMGLGSRLRPLQLQPRFALASLTWDRSRSPEKQAVVLQVCKVAGFELWLGCPVVGNVQLPRLAARLVSIDEAIDRLAPARFLRRAQDPTTLQADVPRGMLIRVLTDPVMHNLALSLASTLHDVANADTAFVDFAASAMQAYIASRLTFTRIVDRKRGGLAPWQQRRASELLLAGISRHVPVTALAEACRLSASHFVRAFRQSTGLPPHQWIMARRVDLSKGLLVDGTARSLADIALICGFADQSHFTRTFSRIVGMSPGAWRRYGAAGLGASATTSSVCLDGG